MLECWHASLKLLLFLYKYFIGMQCTGHFHASAPIWFEETVCKEIFAMFRPIAYITCYGLIFIHCDCSFKNLLLYRGSEERYKQKADTPMKWRKQPTIQTLNFAQEDGYQNTRIKIQRNFKWKIQGKWGYKVTKNRSWAKLSKYSWRYAGDMAG